MSRAGEFLTRLDLAVDAHAALESEDADDPAAFADASVALFVLGFNEVDVVRRRLVRTRRHLFDGWPRIGNRLLASTTEKAHVFSPSDAPHPFFVLFS